MGASPTLSGSLDGSRYDRRPSITVVINTCDRCDALRELIQSLDRQTYREFEVVVVVGPTSDRTLAMLEENFGDRVTVVECSQFNLSVSRNIGLVHAAGDVVAFIDDDSLPCPTWLAQLAAAYSDPQVGGAGGRTYNALPEAGELQFLCGVFSVLAEQEDVRTDDLTPTRSAVSSEHWFPRLHGTNMSYRRQVLLAVGGFDERFEYLFDDADIAARLARAGHRLRQLTQATVYHRPGLGRNRGGHPYDLNWYCWSRSAIYFALKNGTPAVGRRKSLAAALRIASTFRAHVDELRERGDMPDDLYRRARAMLRRGLVEGLCQGLFARRHLPAMLQATTRELIPFQRSAPRSRTSGTVTEVRSGKERSSMHDQPLTVCLLSVGYPPADTHGVSRSTHTLAQGLVELGHEVHVITSGDRHRAILDDGVYVHEVNGGAGDRYRSYASAGYPNLTHWLNHSHAVFDRLRSLLVNHEIQIVDSPLWNLDGIVTAVAGEVPVAVRVVTAMKQISTVHGKENRETRLLGELEHEFLTLASAVISNSRGTVETLGAVYGIDLDATAHYLVPYGIVPVSDSEVPDTVLIDGDKTTVLFVGRLEGRKGILDLFDAIPRVLREAPGARFKIVGADNSREDGFRAANRTDYPGYFKKTHPSCADKVQFLGFVGEQRLQELYRECDVFVAPSLYESFGLVFLEAMNYARPVVGCRAGGPEDIIVDGETGLLVPPQDPQALADALVRLVRSPEERVDLGRAGRRRLLDRYSHLAMAEAFADAYRAVLSPGTETSGSVK